MSDGGPGPRRGGVPPDLHPTSRLMPPTLQSHMPTFPGMLPSTPSELPAPIRDGGLAPPPHRPLDSFPPSQPPFPRGLGVPEHPFVRPPGLAGALRSPLGDGSGAAPLAGAEDASARAAAARLRPKSVRDAEAPPAEELPRKRGKHLMERLLWNGSFLRCPGKNCQGIVERHVEPRHGEMLDCSVRGCNRKLFYCAYCHRAYVIVTEPDWTLGEHGLEICHMADKEAKRRIVEEACEKYRREHPGSKRYPPWQRKELDDILLVREEPGFLTFRVPMWSEDELQVVGDFMQANNLRGLASSSSSCKPDLSEHGGSDSEAGGASTPSPAGGGGGLHVPRIVGELLQRIHDIQLERLRERSQDSTAGGGGGGGAAESSLPISHNSHSSKPTNSSSSHPQQQQQLLHHPAPPLGTVLNAPSHASRLPAYRSVVPPPHVIGGFGPGEMGGFRGQDPGGRGGEALSLLMSAALAHAQAFARGHPAAHSRDDHRRLP